MARLRITIACAKYDRIRPIAEGRVEVEGCEVVFVPLGPEEVFFRAFRYAEFDVSELSLNSSLMAATRGAAAYVPIPVYPSRAFRHSMIYVRTDRGIERPEDLKGKVIGVPEYQQTANVWMRGALDDDYGVRPEDLIWRTGGQEDPGRDERTPLDPPAGVDLAPIPSDKTLSGLFADGALDAYMSARAPSAFLRGSPTIRRLFADTRATERDYFARTGFFPIMHVIGIKQELAAAHPWLAMSLYRAFEEAKTLAIKDLEGTGTLAVSLPWATAELAETYALMGRDFWPYGIARNRANLEAVTRYSHRQGLALAPLTPEDLFEPSTLET